MQGLLEKAILQKKDQSMNVQISRWNTFSCFFPSKFVQSVNVTLMGIDCVEQPDKYLPSNLFIRTDAYVFDCLHSYEYLLNKDLSSNTRTEFCLIYDFLTD